MLKNIPKILIVGRSGTGKDTLTHLITEKTGLKQVISYTTRPRRFPEEDTHIFISPSEADSIHDKVATTVINGYEYFATKRQVEECGIYIIDPKGLYELCANMPDTAFYVIYVMADKSEAKAHAIARSSNSDTEAEIFEKRYESEYFQFWDFENTIAGTNKSSLPCNCHDLWIVWNNYRESSLKGEAEHIVKWLRLINNAYTMVDFLIKKEIVAEENGKIVEWLCPDRLHPSIWKTHKSRMQFVMELLHDNKGLASAAMAYMQNTDLEQPSKTHITHDMIRQGIKNDIISFIDDPNGEGTVCKIGEYWFYFGGLPAVEMTPQLYLINSTLDEIVEEIYQVLEDLETESPNEQGYYYWYLVEALNM